MLLEVIDGGEERARATEDIQIRDGLNWALKELGGEVRRVSGW